MKKFDMHCHTKEGSLDGKVTLEENILKLQSLGYSGMLITDHNSYKAYRYYKRFLQDKYPDFHVLKGIEYDTLDAGHILIILPTNVKVPIIELRGLPVSLLIDIVHHNGGILGPAHPCGEKYLSITNTRRGRKAMELIKRFDFIETFNACEIHSSNHAAMQLALQFDKPGIGGSDSHKINCTGMGYTLVPDFVTTETDLINAVLCKTPISCGGSYYQHTTKQKIGSVNQLLIYSFWVYNKVSASFRYYQRHQELKQYQ